MASGPTLKTFTDIQTFGQLFKSEAQTILDYTQRSIARIERYIYIPTYPTPPDGGWTPDHPNPGPTYNWHPNMLAMYSNAERDTILRYYEALKAATESVNDFLVSPDSSSLFDPTPKLNYVIQMALGGIISG